MGTLAETATSITVYRSPTKEANFRFPFAEINGSLLVPFPFAADKRKLLFSVSSIFCIFCLEFSIRKWLNMTSYFLRVKDRFWVLKSKIVSFGLSHGLPC
jgi:hypothetical protein